MGNNTLERCNNIDDDNNLDNQGGLDISRYKDKELILFDLGGTIVCVSKWIVWAFVPRDIVEHLRTNPIDYTKHSDLNQTKSKHIEIEVEWVKWTVPEWIINQTQKEIKHAFLYPDFYSRITIKRNRDGNVKLVLDEESEKVEKCEKIEHYDNITEFLKHEWYKLGIASVLPKPYGQIVNNLIKEWTFNYKFYSYEIWKLKTNPEFFEHIKEVTGIAYDKMMMIWDSIKSDIVWANQVWINTVLIDRKHKGPPEEIYLKKHWITTTIISTLAQLVEVLFKQ